MDKSVSIFGSEFEYDFLSGWIKYNRLQAGISQEALCHGICSVSHLSYFEKGTKRLRGEIIEALLMRLKITAIMGSKDIGLVRQKLHKLMFQVESFDYEAAQETFKDLLTLESIISISPYNIEFNIYRLMYKILVERTAYSELQTSINTFDKIYESLEDDLKYIYMLSAGKLLYDNINHAEGIARLEKAYKLKETPWITYRLGVAYCLDLQHLKSIFCLEKALNSYSLSGRYRNALECHNFLGSSFAAVKMYEEAERHYKSVLSGSDYFTINKNIFGAYSNLAALYLDMGKFKESLHYCELAMNPPSPSDSSDPWLKAAWHTPEQPMLAACIYVEVQKTLKDPSNCNAIFDKYLCDANKSSLYYNYLYALYLSIHYFDGDKFYEEINNITLPYYKRIGFLGIYKKVVFMLIEHLESRRKYKEACVWYKEITL